MTMRRPAMIRPVPAAPLPDEKESGTMRFLVTYQWPEGYGLSSGQIGTCVVWARDAPAAAWYVRGTFQESYEPVLLDVKQVDG